MRPGIEVLAGSRSVMRREPGVQGSHHSHHARINYSTDRIRIRVTSVEQPQQEPANWNRSNQADCRMTP